MKDLVSVIVPIYKVEDYLENCVNSIVTQTYTNLEIILVDDGSLDNCSQMCDEYAKRDIRIKVIHKENGGLSDARNTGIRIASGEYITCIDSDDYISNDFIEYLYELLITNKADISVCGFIKTSSTNESSQPDSCNVKCYTKDEALATMLYARDFTTSAWGKLYSKRLFDGVEYPIGKYSEDMFTTYQLINKCNKIVWGSRVCYYYLRRNGSILTGNFSKKHLDVFEALHIVRKDIPNNKTKIIKAYESQIISSMAELFEKNASDKFVVDTSLWDEAKKYRIRVFTDKCASKRVRVQGLLMLLGRIIAKSVIIHYYKNKWK